MTDYGMRRAKSEPTEGLLDQAIDLLSIAAQNMADQAADPAQRAILGANDRAVDILIFVRSEQMNETATFWVGTDELRLGMLLASELARRRSQR